MKQPRTKARSSHAPLEALATPVCAKCGGQTRFVGLESDPQDDGADLCTYECIVCQHLQVASFEREPTGKSGTGRAA